MKTQTEPTAPTKLKNKFDRMEWAGAFGDLGTLIPFIVGYITVMKMDPLGVLLMFGILMIIGGSYYKTPLPIQPMKAIGGAAITSAGALTPSMVLGAGIFTGFFWLIMGLTGMLNYISKIATKPVIRGIVLGLGLLFVKDGIQKMQSDLAIAIFALLLTFFLLKGNKVPAMFVLLVVGVAVAIFRDPSLFGQLAQIKIGFRVPELAVASVTWQDFVKGTLILGIPQIPLTLGNAVIAITAENNRLFPDRPVTEKKIAVSQGIMNLVSPIFGGTPMCHGAGGMAGHVRFGARTGGSLVILGCILLILALFFSNSVALIFKIFPECILGVILLFAGLELAVSARDVGREKEDFYILLVTAGFGMWNMGAGFLAGIALQELLKRKIIAV